MKIEKVGQNKKIRIQFTTNHGVGEKMFFKKYGNMDETLGEEV